MQHNIAMHITSDLFSKVVSAIAKPSISLSLHNQAYKIYYRYIGIKFALEYSM